MIKTVVREHHFSPQEIDAFFLDAHDHWGLLFWYEDVKEVYAEMNKKK